jgi:hypothetical protein
MNGSTHQVLCDVLDEKEPAAGASANEQGQNEDLAALLQGRLRTHADSLLTEPSLQGAA